jgi:rubrerythrin
MAYIEYPGKEYQPDREIDLALSSQVMKRLKAVEDLAEELERDKTHLYAHIHNLQERVVRLETRLNGHDETIEEDEIDTAPTIEMRIENLDVEVSVLTGMLKQYGKHQLPDRMLELERSARVHEHRELNLLYEKIEALEERIQPIKTPIHTCFTNPANMSVRSWHCNDCDYNFDADGVEVKPQAIKPDYADLFVKMRVLLNHTACAYPSVIAPSLYDDIVSVLDETAPIAVELDTPDPSFREDWTCKECGEEFDNPTPLNCEKCGKPVCDDCFLMHGDFRLCNNCWEQKQNEVQP